MSTASEAPFEIAFPPRSVCLCLDLQRAARAVARRFDAAFRPLDLTNGQFSLLLALQWGGPNTIGRLATLLAMDRTTLTAALKPLDRRGLVTVAVDPGDRRSRRLSLTRQGQVLLAAALPIWHREHSAIDALFGAEGPQRLHADLRALV
ncbi:MAG TPA: MarR family winged helix-turn-helix transcriptional regulator [Stellaceae bacterium]|nr:MarR family winged helix-turn-helix transcriptional regulator [Stellaceae bacterium]